MKVAVITLGCKTNQAESFQWENMLCAAGHRVVDVTENPDLCIINTCTVTSKADYQSRQLVQRALRTQAKVVVTGCYAELNHTTLKTLNKDIEIVSNSDKDTLLDLLALETPERNNPRCHYSRQRPIIKVQDGCNYSCSYCAITLARGRSRSVPTTDVIEEVKKYEAAGYREVVLTGIHLGTYGLDLAPQVTLSSLLISLLNATTSLRIRLSSLEVKEINDELIDLLMNPRICNHLHIPLQSGADTVLKLMNRTYGTSDFIKGIERIVKVHPYIGLGTDIIVGFPGEGEEEFRQTVNLIETVPFSYIHVFPFSPRPHTKAASFPQQVDGKTKKNRVALLRSIGEEKKKLFLEKNIGTTTDVIIEEPAEGGYIGTSSNYIRIYLEEAGGYGRLKAGMLVNTRVVGTKDSMALGNPLKSQQLTHL
ncbi:MAG: tRNA (N(6)-L-threonylcarbamoyladenosine(37)-C(2))-methylthiotransferase MtaB [Nitrospirota bacterium]